MQTFLPYPDFKACAACLDRQRLGNQRNEARTVLAAVEGTSTAWAGHPVVAMWRGYAPALRRYTSAIVEEWCARGYRNSVVIEGPFDGPDPSWLGDEKLHASHRANLLRKLPEHYGQLGWLEDPAMPYFWPGVEEEAKVVEARTKPKVYQTVRQLVEELLLQNDPPMAYPDILSRVGEVFPKAKTSVNSIRWYASEMRDRGETVPVRPRAAAGEDKKLNGRV